MMPGGQLALPLPPVRRPVRGPLLPAPSNADALTWLRRTDAWPQGRLALWGGGGVGKTHALHLWAGRTGAAVLDGAAVLREAPAVHGPVAIDDAEQAPDETALLHLLNRAAEGGHKLLLASRSAPSRWNVSLPDLASRLRAITAVEFGPPEDRLLRALMARLLAQRQLAVPETVQDWLLARLPRTAAAIRDAVRLLERAAQHDRGITRAAAAGVAAALERQGDFDEAYETSTRPASAYEAALL